MAMTVAVKEVEVVAAAIAFPHCNSGIPENIGNSRTDIFSSV